MAFQNTIVILFITASLLLLGTFAGEVWYKIVPFSHDYTVKDKDTRFAGPIITRRPDGANLTGSGPFNTVIQEGDKCTVAVTFKNHNEKSFTLDKTSGYYILNYNTGEIESHSEDKPW